MNASTSTEKTRELVAAATATCAELERLLVEAKSLRSQLEGQLADLAEAIEAQRDAENAAHIGLTARSEALQTAQDLVPAADEATDAEGLRHVRASLKRVARLVA